MGRVHKGGVGGDPMALGKVLACTGQVAPPLFLVATRCHLPSFVAWMVTLKAALSLNCASESKWHCWDLGCPRTLHCGLQRVWQMTLLLVNPALYPRGERALGRFLLLPPLVFGEIGPSLLGACLAATAAAKLRT